MEAGSKDKSNLVMLPTDFLTFHKSPEEVTYLLFTYFNKKDAIIYSRLEI